jgi:hypothetical protein
MRERRAQGDPLADVPGGRVELVEVAGVDVRDPDRAAADDR